jgi:DNA-directed RNA polymerase subunit alpha
MDKRTLNIIYSFEGGIATLRQATERLERSLTLVKQLVNENLWKDVNDLELSVRSSCAIANLGIRYVGELVQKTESDLLKSRNFRRRSLEEIKEVLADMGLELGMKLEDWSPGPPTPKSSCRQWLPGNDSARILQSITGKKSA